VINSTSAQQNDPFHILQTQISRCFRDYYCDSFIEGEKVEAKLVDLGLDALKIEKNIVTFSDEELIMISEEYRCLPPPNPKIIRASRNVQKKVFCHLFLFSLFFYILFFFNLIFFLFSK